MDLENYLRTKELTGGALIIKAKGYGMEVKGTTTKLSVRNFEKTNEFIVFPLTSETDKIIIEIDNATGDKVGILNLTMEDDGVYAHFMNKDPQRWIPSLEKPTQPSGYYLEILVGEDRFTDNPKGSKNDMYVVSGDALARYLNEDIGKEELRQAVEDIPEKKKLEDALAEAETGIQSREEEIRNLEAELKQKCKENKVLMNDNTELHSQLTTTINAMRRIYLEFSKPFLSRVGLLGISLKTLGLSLYNDRTFFTRPPENGI